MSLQEQFEKMHDRNEQLSQEVADLKAKGDKLALALRRLAQSVYIHPDYGKGQPNEFFDRVDGAHLALAEWKGEKEPIPGKLALEQIEERKQAIEWYRNPAADGAIKVHEVDPDHAPAHRYAAHIEKNLAGGHYISAFLGYQQGMHDTLVARSQGEVWVKASDRLPEMGGWYFIRSGKLKDKYLWRRMEILERHKQRLEFEWLDESPEEKEVTP